MALKRQVASKKLMTSLAAGASPSDSAFSNKHAAISGPRGSLGALVRIRSLSTRRRRCPQRLARVESIKSMASLLGTRWPPVMARSPFRAPPATRPAAFLALEKLKTSTGLDLELLQVAGVFGVATSRGDCSRGRRVSSVFCSLAISRCRLEIQVSRSSLSAQQKTKTLRKVLTCHRRKRPRNCPGNSWTCSTSAAWILIRGFSQS
mmetsp:Transcript_85667/g.205324  ORF Transcript_85667/g.205324 Transcript_85667/m.205324 type:complete len:206 (-) Transcript_85667:862-1479(-)